MNLRPVLYVNGLITTLLALAMVIPMLVDLHSGSEDWQVFCLCIFITGFAGGLLILTNNCEVKKITPRQGFLITTSLWVTLSAFSALPFWLSEFNMSFTDAMFESVSGISTTGATIIAGLDSAPPGLLIWRALLQWLGGIGIVVLALTLLPFLRIGGMQLFQTESSEKSQKALPKTGQLAIAIGAIYLFLTFICAICYQMAGFSTFNAFAHAMTTVATGGFSTFDSSFAGHDNVMIEVTAIVFMLLGGLPFILYLKAVNGRPGALFRDAQVRAFLGIVFIAAFALTVYLVFKSEYRLDQALLKSLFNVVSVITGTGYTSDSYDGYGTFPLALFFFLMFIGGCAGSTTCGMKIFRFQILYAVCLAQIRQLISPHALYNPKFNGSPIPSDVPPAVFAFFFVYAMSFVVVALLLGLTGLNFITAFSCAATMVSNVGPGLGAVIGPSGNFASLPDAAKWISCFAMILGRLEIFTVLILFLPSFWRR